VTSRIVPIARILEARTMLEGRVTRTPTLGSQTAASALAAAGGPRLADGRLYVKAEHLQKTGSFKPRGALTKVETLDAGQRKAGIVTVSAGNAAQAFAWAGLRAGVPVTVVMPVAAVRSKVDACVGYGADVILHGTNIADTWRKMEQLTAERGLVYCHPFDDPDLIAGHASAGLEILDDLPDVDVVIVAIGGGGLISGVATAIKESRPAVRVYGVEPEGARAMTLALEAGESVRITPATVADGLTAPFAGEWTLPIVQRYVDDVIVLDDPSILTGVRFAAERMKQVLEPAGAAALAAVLHQRVPIRSGERVCVVASGGNVELSRLGELLEAAAPLPAATVVA
jgi:threonine dehydratase